MSKNARFSKSFQKPRGCHLEMKSSRLGPQNASRITLVPHDVFDAEGGLHGPRLVIKESTCCKASLLTSHTAWNLLHDTFIAHSASL